MRRSIIWLTVVLLCAATLWGAFDLLPASQSALPSFMPGGALLYLEAKDFRSLLKDWNESEQKKTWLTSDNYESFGKSRLFSRLSQAQDEFASAAGFPTDNSLLSKVAGKDSCLALYDIGNLEFVYVTRLNEQDLESTPLWQTRGTFEQRTEGGTPFYVRHDPQSRRTAAFAASKGWLILGTRDDLVAGVLDRISGATSRSLPQEAWYADVIKQAPAQQGDLRMVLHMETIVATPHFRSYWVQRNVTELKQLSAAVSDLYRTPDSYREQRTLLRKAGSPSTAGEDVNTIVAMAPHDATFYSAQASPDVISVLKTLRDNVLEFKFEQTVNNTNAPTAPPAIDPGSATDLDVQIDNAPVIEHSSDPFQSLRAVLTDAQPNAVMTVYSSAAPDAAVFAPIASAVVIIAPQSWNSDRLRMSLSQSLGSGLTAGALGTDWDKRHGVAGDYYALHGAVALYVFTDRNRALVSNDAPLLTSLMMQATRQTAPPLQKGLTYNAVFRHAQEQPRFRTLMARLDQAGHRGRSDGDAVATEGEAPAFFSGNIASLSHVFSQVSQETMEERDEGEKVTQTVTYTWTR